MRGVLVVLALTASLAYAAPPEVPEVVLAKAGQLVKVKVKSDGEVGSAINFKDNDAFWGEMVSNTPGERLFVFQASADLKEEKAFVVAWWTPSEKTGKMTTIKVSPLNFTPAPKPTPDPNPPQPKPPAKVEHVRVAVVTESSDLSSNKAEFYSDKALQAYWKEKGWEGVWWIDPDAKDPTSGKMPVKWQPYADRAKMLKLDKALFIVDRDSGIILYEGAIPATPDDLLKLLKEKTGG